MTAEVWHLTGWVGPPGRASPTMEVWANRPETWQSDNVRAAIELYHAYGEGLSDKPAWGGPGGLVLKFVRDTHPLAGFKTVYWTIQ